MMDGRSREEMHVCQKVFQLSQIHVIKREGKKKIGQNEKATRQLGSLLFKGE